MFGSRLSIKRVAAMLLAVALAGGVSTVEAQTARRTRRESNANRKARVERTIQETYGHRWEVGGGGGYLRFRSGQNLQRNNEVTFWVSGTYNLNPKLGVIGDVRGAYGNAKVGNTIFNIPNPQISEYTFMVGPSYRFYTREKTSISGFATAGAAIGKFDGGSKGIPANLLGIWPSETRAAFSLGANFDYNFYPNFAARLTPTYLGTTFGGTIQNNLGVNVGLVYRFGKIK